MNAHVMERISSEDESDIDFSLPLSASTMQLLHEEDVLRLGRNNTALNLTLH